MSFLGQTLPWPARLTTPRAPAKAPREGVAWPRVRQVALTAWQKLISARAAHTSSKRLRVVEKVLLGDKQFVALLELDGKTFLASGGQGVPMSLTPSEALHPAGARTRSPKSGAKPAKPAVAHAGRRKAPAEKAPRRAAASETARAARPRKKIEGEFEGKSKPAPRTAMRKKASPAAARAGAPKQVKQTAKRKAEPRAKREKVLTDSGEKRSLRGAGAVSLEPVELIPAIAVLDPAQKTARMPFAVLSRLTKKPRSVAAEKPLAVARDAEPAQSPVASAAAMAQAEASNRTVRGPAAEISEPARAALRLSGLETAVAEVDEKKASASTAFAALLELRMLASEVFQELESQEQELETAAPVGGAVVREPELAAVRKKEPASSAAPGFRRRLSAFACFLVMVLVPHETARAAALPVAQLTPAVLASWSAPPGFAHGRSLFAGGAAVDVLAAAAPRSDEIRISGLGGSSASWSIVVVLTLLTLIPSLLFCITPFARLLIVFHFLRQALGLQTTPSNQTLIGLSLILTFFLMQPTGAVIYRDAIVPAQAGAITPLDAVVRAGEPMRHFMAHYVREKDAELFLEIAKEPRPRSVEDLSFRVLLPAYILSELKAGFQIGTVLFLPFLIVDMVVASITTSVGMMQLPPVVISTPLKLLLFLMVDGWHLLIGALMRSFN